MTPEEHQTIKALARITVEGIVSSVEKQKDEKHMERIITPEEVKAVTPEAFWKKIRFGESQECWEWQSHFGRGGYGQWSTTTKDGERKTRVPHCYVFASLFGKVSKGIFICHRCDNPKCANPNHLFAGTPQENSSDMVRKGRQRKGDKHGMSKLKNSDIPIIRERLKNGEMQTSIARSYGMDKTSIGAIARGETWNHIISY